MLGEENVERRCHHDEAEKQQRSLPQLVHICVGVDEKDHLQVFSITSTCSRQMTYCGDHAGQLHTA